MEKLKILIIFFGLIFAYPTGAASLYLSPSGGTFTVDENFTVTLYVSDLEQAINATQTIINFPPDKLEIMDISKENSIINLWIREPIGSNLNGVIQLEGISLNPGFIGSQGKIASFIFKIKNSGEAALNISQGSVLANDGFGTEILKSTSGAKFNLAAATPPPTVEQPTIPTKEIAPPITKEKITPKPKPKIETTSLIPPKIEPPEPSEISQSQDERKVLSKETKEITAIIKKQLFENLKEIIKNFWLEITVSLLLITLGILIIVRERRRLTDRSIS